LTIFYSLLVVTLFVPILGGLYTQRARSGEALAAIASGVLTMFIVRFGFAGDYQWLDPTLAGVLVATTAFGTVAALRKA
jgi:Na+/pantothenate symporter